MRNISNSSVVIAWEKPFDAFKKVTQYVVDAEPVSSYSSSLPKKMTWSVQPDLNEYELSNLHPATTYNITLISLQGSEPLDNVTVEVTTHVGVPSPKPQEPVILSESDSTKTIEIGGPESVYHNNNGPVSVWRVVVHIVEGDLYQNFDPELLKDFKGSKDDGLPYYIAAELENRTRTFTVGDGKTYGDYENVPLPLGKHIHISVGVVSTLDNVTEVLYSDTTHEQHSILELSTTAGPIVEDGTNQTLIIIMTAACIIFGLLLICSSIAYCFLRVMASRRNNQRLTDLHELAIQPHTERENNAYVGDNFASGSFTENLALLVDKLDSNHKLQRRNLTLDIDHIIAKGSYGDVIQGNVTKNNISTHVQVHIINDDMEKADQQSFLRDFNDLLEIRGHQCFLYFLGVCQTPDWFYLIFEQVEKTLKSFLLDARMTAGDKYSSVSEEYILNLIGELCMAMEYLEKNKIIHKNINSYNVRVNQDDECKLIFFGPTHFVESSKAVDTSRWQAPEVLKSHFNHSSKSDVWSFAILMWECCSLGATPYGNIANTDLLPRIRNGARPEQVRFIFDDLYQLLLNCWELDAKERPTFEEINSYIKQLTSTSIEYTISFKARDGIVLPYYQPSLELKP